MEATSKNEVLFFFQEELRQLEEQYNIGGKIIWLTGREGIGKTAFVKHFAEQVGDYEYIDLETADVGEPCHYPSRDQEKTDPELAFHEKLKELIQVKRLVILDNYDYRFQQNERSFLEVSKLQKKLGETKSTVIVVSRERLFMYPMFIYMASLLHEHNYRIDLKDPNFKKILRMFMKSHSLKDRLLLSSCLDGAMNKLVCGLSSQKSVREDIIDLLGYRDFWMEEIKRDLVIEGWNSDEICKFYRCVANGINNKSDIQRAIDKIIDRKYYPSLSYIKYLDYNRGSVKNCFYEFAIRDQSIKFFFRFVYDYDPKTDAGAYYDEKIAPYLESFAVEYWHEANFRHCGKEYRHEMMFQPMEGRLWTENGTERVLLLHIGFERSSLENMICDYNVSETPYGMDRLLKVVSWAERTEEIPRCGRVSMHVFSVSGFTAEVEKKAQELGIVLYNNMWYRDKQKTEGADNQ